MSAAGHRLRFDLNLGTLLSLPAWSAGPRGDWPHLHDRLRDAGYQGVQAADPSHAQARGLPVTTIARLETPADADTVAADRKAKGFETVVLHVGTGFEDDAACDAFAAAILEAQARHGIPLLVETHRATMTQDLRRTLDLVARFPDLRFNGDFSHWYTGHEMTYGDVPAKIARLAPVLSRVRALHGRISTPGAIQVAIDPDLLGGDREPDHVRHFRMFWTESARGYLADRADGPPFTFAPELLPPRIHYARLVPGPDGALREEGDRWLQANLLCRLFAACWEAAGGPPPPPVPG